MKVVRFQTSDGRIHYGRQTSSSTIEAMDGDPFEGLRPTGRTLPTPELLCPIVPTAILGVGLNYKRHAEESGAKVPEFPVLFAKGLNTVQHPGRPIEIPTRLPSEEVDYECELAVVIGRRAKNVRAQDALGFVLGYTCANDVSARDWQLRKGGGQWSRGKFFDTFCPLGPCLVTPDEIPDPNALRLRTVLNGQVVQDWNTNDMIFTIPKLIEFLSASTTLLPGTVILTGTPHGVGMAAKPPRWLRAGDSVTIDIEKIGQLTNPVALEA